MSTFADLTPYTYDSRDWDGRLLNVGWLGGDSHFDRGAVPPDFVAALAALCRWPGWLHRGVHECELCPAGSRAGFGDPASLEYGNGQIRILGSKEVWYAAPTLVHHYVVAHGYVPPSEFVQAVCEPLAIGVDGYLYASFPPDFQRERAASRLKVTGTSNLT